MKVTTRGSRVRHGRKVVAICLTFTILVVAAIAAYWFYQNDQINKQQQTVKEITRIADARVAEIEAKKKEPVYITLPGAEKIQALVDNYETPTSIWTLANKQHALGMEYVPAELVTPTVPIRTNATNDEQHVRSVIVEPLAVMFAAAKKDGHNLMIGSAYRSAATQDSLFKTYVASAGYEEADKYSAHPGHSEHQTGLAVDISTTSQQCYLSECFIGTADGQWLADNAYKYGFALRYLKGKEAITGYNFEPWHYRYVGTDLATALHQSGLTLEEAWPYLETALVTLKSNRAVAR